MAYDEELALRLQGLLGDEDGLTTKEMFGGLAFLVHGNMAVAASGKGGLMVRVDPAHSDVLLERPHASRMVMGGREMDGWLRVDESQLDDAQLAEWVARGLDFARGLPPKEG